MVIFHSLCKRLPEATIITIQLLRLKNSPLPRAAPRCPPEIPGVVQLLFRAMRVGAPKALPTCPRTTSARRN